MVKKYFWVSKITYNIIISFETYFLANKSCCTSIFSEKSSSLLLV